MALLLPKLYDLIQSVVIQYTVIMGHLYVVVEYEAKHGIKTSNISLSIKSIPMKFKLS